MHFLLGGNNLPPRFSLPLLWNELSGTGEETEVIHKVFMAALVLYLKTGSVLSLSLLLL